MLLIQSLPSLLCNLLDLSLPKVTLRILDKHPEWNKRQQDYGNDKSCLIFEVLLSGHVEVVVGSRLGDPSVATGAEPDYFFAWAESGHFKASLG